MALLFAFSSQAQEAGSPIERIEPEVTGKNEHLRQLPRQTQQGKLSTAQDYRIGPHDLLQITVFEAPELSGSVRVSGGGEISLPLLDSVQAAGLTEEELERVLEELLRRQFMKAPHVGVFVREMESHPVAVFGAVEEPGVYQIRAPRSLVEVLSLAGGLAPDAGDTVLVTRGRMPPGAEGNGWGGRPVQVDATEKIDLKELLESGDERLNVRVHPGDIVKVTRAGIVYVVGDVNKPGGFVLKSNEKISVLQAIALAEGLTSTSAKGDSLIIRAAQDGSRSEIPIDLGKVLRGEEPDPRLQANDILFVPNSTAKTAALRGLEAVVRTVSGLIIFSSR